MKKIFLSFIGLLLIVVLALFNFSEVRNYANATFGLDFSPINAIFPSSQEIDFNADIRPIFNTKCIACHGGVKESGGFSLFSREDALRKTKSGKSAIIVGKPDESEMVKRLLAKDPEERMPYHAEPLSKEEVEKIRQWIRQGAKWKDHWAYLPLEKPEIPKIDTAWGKNPIDNFVFEKQKEHGLSPSPPADRATLIRRLSLDLIGLPPTLEEVADFQNDKSEKAHEKVVDRLLASPHFGERWAAMWLDLARYADSKGYEKDTPRQIWRFRDYVIQSFNEDKPFDQFTIEQLAGDLLPEPTENQLIATAYHRNTTNNDEGGTDDEEFRTTALIDRVSNTWEVWQGITMGCVQCHSHPYDPFRHEEFYTSLAFFNNTRDEDIPAEYPIYQHFKPEEEAKILKIKNWIATQLTESEAKQKSKEIDYLLRIGEPKIHAHSFDTLTNAAMVDGKILGGGHLGFARLKNIDLSGKKELLLACGTNQDKGLVEIRKDRLDGEVVASFVPENTKSWWSMKKFAVKLKPTEGKHDLYFVFKNPTFENPQDYVCLIEWVLFLDNLIDESKPDASKIKQEILALLNTKSENTPIMQENQGDFRRKTQVFIRGNWLVKGQEVQPKTPKALPKFENYAPNRLGLAKWLVSQENPLTARVMVNRFWEQIFGTGIVETLEDFGSQGIKPTNQKLLDWLAVQFRDEYKWSVKKLLKTIVLSATYQQSSKSNKNLIEKDPDNRYLARGARVRLSAEQIRDQALAVSGLLSKKMYGQSVMPPQPEGVWQVVYSGEKWETSKDGDAWRRGIYTFWRRSVPYPSMMTFDASAREVCVSRRIRTNTPLQALVTLNDTVYIAAARGLAKQMLQEQGLENQLKKGYELLVFKKPTAQTLKVLHELYEKSLKYYQAKPDEVKKIVGKDAKPSGLKNLTALAATTVTANVLLNLDEVIMKE
ncbi:DUF1553 domain-containing protein [Thermoflexibacter ruber]|uniref:Carbohydrate binding module (Family 6) n=1 Tax=Thermoflexibacter ruber TaxID=1003 RepID=A0A1I2H9W6_9BACT|nr:DUF1553 domain-containing protein [Thermoflexibacter ruber]SFF25391.1 Carbohydrate binding module (family 6) [Thermoflexibacter ruber]